MISKKDYYELRFFRGGVIGIDGEISERLKGLIEKKLIEPAGVEWRQTSDSEWEVDVKAWKLSVQGEDELEEFENATKNEAENKENRRKDRDISIINIIMPVITFFLGLIIDRML